MKIHCILALKLTYSSMEMLKIDQKSVRKKIVALINRGGNYMTNYYRSALAEELLHCENESAIVFLNPESGHYKLYYAASNFEAAGELFNCIDVEQVYMELISPNGLSAADFANYLKYFEFKALYIKMEKSLDSNSAKILHENSHNLEDIYSRLCATFDNVYSHIMSYEDLKKAKLITVVKNEELKGFIVFKVVQNSAVLDFIANYGIKSDLLELWQRFYETLNFLNISELSLWCNASNKKALNMYTMEQFSPCKGYNYFFKLL